MLEFEVVALEPADRIVIGERAPDFTRPLVLAEFWEDVSLTELTVDGPVPSVFDPTAGPFRPPTCGRGSPTGIGGTGCRSSAALSLTRRRSNNSSGSGASDTATTPCIPTRPMGPRRPMALRTNPTAWPASRNRDRRSFSARASRLSAPPGLPASGRGPPITPTSTLPSTSSSTVTDRVAFLPRRPMAGRWVTTSTPPGRPSGVAN